MEPKHDKQAELITMARKTSVVVLVILLIVLPLMAIGYGYRVFLLAFGGVLVAVLLRSLATGFSWYTSLRPGLSLAVALILILLIGGGGVWLAAPQVSRQIDTLADKLPESMHRLETWVEDYGWGRYLIQTANRQFHSMLEQGTLITKTTDYMYTVIWVATGVLVIVFIGLYFAYDPHLYHDGFAQCLPARKRARAREVLQGIEHALQRWLLGKIVSMTIVGVLTGIGLWGLGIPLALTLGIIAGLLAFIPNFGPVMSVIPAVLLGLLQGPMMALYVLALYSAVQLVESYLITPIIQSWAVSLPPVLLITFQVLMGVLAGSLGLIFATPLLVALIVVVEMLYIQDHLGEQVEVAGNSDPRTQK